MIKKLLFFFCLSIFCSGFSQLNRDIYVFEDGNQKGYVDHNLNIIIPANYQELGGSPKKFNGYYSIFKKNNKYGVLNMKGEHLITAKYDYLSYSQIPGVFQCQLNNKYGLVDSRGKEIIPALYDYSPDFINKGKAIVAEKERKYGILAPSGNPIIPYNHEYIDANFESTLQAFRKKDSYGYINHKGTEIIPATFGPSRNFRGKYAIVTKEGSYGIINKKGELVLPAEYQDIRYKWSFFGFGNERPTAKVYFVKKDNKIGVFDKNLKVITAPIYDEIGNFKDGVAVVSKNNKYGFINAKGKVVIPLEYEDADFFSEGLAPVVKNGKWGFIDTKNNVVIDFKFKGCVKPFSEGLAVYRKRNHTSSKAHYVDDRCGYINKKGEIEIDTKYKEAQNFNKGVGVIEDEQNRYLLTRDLRTFLLKSIEDEPVIMESY
ncbi:WG repeat-containing protein [Aquimarina sp. D1M17]|uniref:WG repeat-containing protein n=1 Tax=Aquimarina acroporae TaxID=2937283 RepID=UPI0020C01FCB|nr:WG repeat-containing protein [Aquimarina acroporae]MCK8523135.1 WG repeat-containing protein [Aquimarina acroporae]